MSKKKNEVSIVRSSAAEYLTFAAATGDSELEPEATIKKYLIVQNGIASILQDAGKVSAEMARIHAETEFEKYRIVQDRLYESDFDRFLIEDGGDDDE